VHIVAVVGSEPGEARRTGTFRSLMRAQSVTVHDDGLASTSLGAACLVVVDVVIPDERIVDTVVGRG